MANTVFDAGHIFHHYLETNIPNEEWEKMPVEDALGIIKDMEALFLGGGMSPSEFAKKYRLPRKK